MVPTKRFWLLVALGIIVAAYAGMVANVWVAVAYNLALIGAAWVTSRMAPSLDNLKISRRFDPVLSVRVPNRILLSLNNEGPEAIVGQIRDEPPPTFEADRKQFPLRLSPGQERTLDYHITPYERGTDFFRGTYLRIACPLGLVQKQVLVHTEQPIRIYPNVLALREFDLLKQKGKLNQMGIRQSRTRGLGSDFESLRDYTDGDDFRKVDWKATARKGHLVVRQYEQERNQPVIICIDTGRMMLSEVNGVRKLDHALDSLLMLAHAAQIAGDMIGLLVYSDTVQRYIPPKKGRNQMGMIVEAVHDLVAEPVQSAPEAAFAYLQSRWKRRSLVITFTDVDDTADARALITSLGSLSARHITLLARVADPRLKELVETGVENSEDLFKKASALMFSNERHKIGSILSTAGIHNLDSEPQDLAAALVSFYFMVKEKSLL